IILTGWRRQLLHGRAVLDRRAALPANMSETVTTGKFSVEGESGSEADEHGGAARAVRRGSRGSGRSLRRGSPA
ncbi:MAG TPA: hypothetical protein VKB81_00970, partial [Nitrospira sp.]|nr:hypothetical protein [Nitrospira sp.]